LAYVDASSDYCVDAVYRRRLTFEEFLDQYIDFTSAPVLDAELESYHRAHREVVRRQTSDAAALASALAAYRSRVEAAIGPVCPAAATAEEMWALAAGIAGFEPHAESWTTDFPIPGRADRPAEVPAGWMLTAAVNVFNEGRLCGHIPLSLVTGRRWSLFARGGAFDIPDTWQPLGARSEAAVE
jgi:hypothetical protein